jgi:tRNA dimethylallyltransferase
LITNNKNIIVILGPTASGKTRLATRIAHAIGSEIISADSRQVFRNMNIGTGKDYQEYIIEGIHIPYHLIDIADAGEHYFVHRFMEDFYNAFESVSSKNIVPVLCGGSGMYIDAVLSGFEYAAVPNDHSLRASIEGKNKEELLNIFRSIKHNSFTDKADVSTTKRLIRAIEISSYLNNNEYTATSHPKLSPVIIGLSLPVDERRKRIEERLVHRLQNGLIEEVKILLTSVSETQLVRYGLEYKFVVMHINGELTYDQLRQQLTVAIQQFAKRQMTYFRKMERDGFHIHWIDASLPAEEQVTRSLQIISKFVTRNP